VITPDMEEVIRHELNLKDVRNASEYTVISIEYLRDKPGPGEVPAGTPAKQEPVIDLPLNSDAEIGADISI
jgi:hypothetical protein